MLNRRHFTLGALGALGTLQFASARAQGSANKPIRLVVPTGTGTGSDLAARHFAAGLGRLMQTSVVVDNRLGAGGVIGTEYVARAEPDGSTLLFTFASHYINQWVTTTSFDAVKDFEPIARLNLTALVLVTAAGSPYRSVQDVVAAARRKPNSVSYGSAGVGGVSHMAGALLESVAGVELNHVPYKVPSQALIETSSGLVDVTFAGMTAVLPLIQSGRLRPLGVTTSARSRHLPDVPTLAQAGLTGYEIASAIVVLAPKGTPQERIRRLSDAFTRLAGQDDFRDFCRIQGCEVDVLNSANANAAAPVELARWKRLAELAGIKTN